MALFTMHDMANELAEFAGSRSARQRAGDQKRAQKLRGRRKGGVSKKGVAKAAGILAGAGLLTAGGLRYGKAAGKAYRAGLQGGMSKRNAAGMAIKEVGSGIRQDAISAKQYAGDTVGSAKRKLGDMGSSIKNRMNRSGKTKKISTGSGSYGYSKKR